MLYGNFKRKLDGQGKIIIPRRLRNSLKGETVVVVGCGDHVEIWTQEQWAREQPKMKKSLDNVLS